MDGRQKSLTGSLQFRLSASLSVLIASLAIGAGVAAYQAAFDDAIEWQDGNLRQMSAMTDGRYRADLPTTVVDTVPDPDLQVVVEIVGPSHDIPASSPLRITKMQDGLQTTVVDGEGWRVYARPLDGGDRLVVAQRSAERDEVAGKSALRAILPLAALLPVLIALVSIVVQRALRPLVALSGDLDRRSLLDLRPLLDGPVPNELRPFTASINELLGRLGMALEAQRRFVADAAHELRSPLTVLTLQAEQLAARITTAQEREFMARLQNGMLRMRALLDQLLILARAENGSGEGDAPKCYVAEVLRQVVADQLPLAESRRIDLGVVGSLPEVMVPGRKIDLQALLRNLVDNAIRYSPVSSRVDICVHSSGDRVRIEVADQGPGMSATDLARAFDPFYRVLGTNTEGSGLGLAIVRVIVDRMGGTVTLHNEEPGGGLRAAVDLPRLDTDEPSPHAS